MAFYTINNRCLEFDNKLIATSAEPVVIHNWYARTGFTSFKDLSEYLYNTYHYDLGTPHTTYSARLEARAYPYPESIRFEITTNNTPFDIDPHMLVYPKSLMPIKLEDDYNSNNLTILMDSLSSKVYDTFSGNVSEFPPPYVGGYIALYSTYSSNPVNLFNENGSNRIETDDFHTITGQDYFGECINNETDLFYSATEHHGYFPDVSADASDTYFPLEKDNVDLHMNIATNSAVSGEILYNLNNTVYTGNMWLDDIVTTNDNKLTFAFDNAVFPSATDPDGVMFFN